MKGEPIWLPIWAIVVILLLVPVMVLWEVAAEGLRRWR